MRFISENALGGKTPTVTFPAPNRAIAGICIAHLTQKRERFIDTITSVTARKSHAYASCHLALTFGLKNLRTPDLSDITGCPTTEFELRLLRKSRMHVNKNLSFNLSTRTS